MTVGASRPELLLPYSIGRNHAQTRDDNSMLGDWTHGVCLPSGRGVASVGSAFFASMIFQGRWDQAYFPPEMIGWAN
jgi:hypothetical protein